MELNTQNTLDEIGDEICTIALLLNCVREGFNSWLDLFWHYRLGIFEKCMCSNGKDDDPVVMR